MTLRPTILRFDSLPSTNTEAARQAALGAPEGLCVVAREQTAGRGRQQRAWISPPDAGLYFSIVLRPQLEMRAWPLITLMAALAVADALARGVRSSKLTSSGPTTSMPAGASCAASSPRRSRRRAGRACIVGIGINLKDSAFPSELRELATSVEALTGSAPDVEEVLQALTRAISERYARSRRRDGREQTLREWARALIFRRRQARPRLARNRNHRGLDARACERRRSACRNGCRRNQNRARRRCDGITSKHRGKDKRRRVKGKGEGGKVKSSLLLSFPLSRFPFTLLRFHY